MTNASRHLLLGLLLALGLNHLVLGLAWLGTYQSPGPVLLAASLYFLVLVLSLYSTRSLKISAAQAYLNLAVSFAAPALVLSQTPVAKYSPEGSYQTWFVGAISLILAITSGRGYPVLGWIGTGALWAEVLVWGGVQKITTTGLIGALLIVLAAYALGRGLRSTQAAADSYHLQAATIRAKTAQSVAARETRTNLAQSVMFTGIPLLKRIRDEQGELSPADKQEALLLEGRFRDGIQGGNLITDGVRLATREARLRGVTVSFSDLGGLDNTDPAELAAIHASIIQSINATESGRINISAPANEPYKVGIVAQRPEAAAPDLWLRLP